MADKFGQFDNGLSGGSDVWDNGLAGEILLADYFAESAPTEVTGTASGSLALTGAAVAGVHVNGIASGSIALTGSSAGAVQVNAVGAGSLALTGATVATVRISGAGTGLIALTGVSEGVARVTGAATGILALTGEATVLAVLAATTATGNGIFLVEGAGVARNGPERLIIRMGRGGTATPIQRNAISGSMRRSVTGRR